MNIHFVWDAPENMIIAEGALDHLIGKEIPLLIGGDTKGTGILKKALVINDGHSVAIVYEMPESVGSSWLGLPTTLDASLLDIEY